jgi:hypothetical protein
LVPLVSLGVKYLVTGDFSHTAFVALLTAAGVAAGGVLLQFLLKLQSAISDNILPTVTATGTLPTPTSPAGSAAIFAPPLTAETLRGLLETVDVLQQWQRSVAPPATISHRIVTGTGEGVVLGTEAPVKRSHHAAKAPAVVAPLDVHSDS